MWGEGHHALAQVLLRVMVGICRLNVPRTPLGKIAKFIPQPVWSSIEAPAPGSRFEAWLTAQVRRRVFPMAAAAQPPRMPPAEKALARKLHFDQGKIPAELPLCAERCPRKLFARRAPNILQHYQEVFAAAHTRSHVECPHASDAGRFA